MSFHIGCAYPSALLMWSCRQPRFTFCWESKCSSEQPLFEWLGLRIPHENGVIAFRWWRCHSRNEQSRDDNLTVQVMKLQEIMNTEISKCLGKLLVVCLLANRSGMYSQTFRLYWNLSKPLKTNAQKLMVKLISFDGIDPIGTAQWGKHIMNHVELPGLAGSGGCSSQGSRRTECPRGQGQGPIGSYREILKKYGNVWNEAINKFIV